jgi:hypothetical protein
VAAADGGGQTSIWVPIVVGAIGLAGVLAAQLIASVRAKNERKAVERRDEIQWRRQREEREEAFAREDRYRSHAERSAAYAALGLAIDRWIDQLGTAQAYWRTRHGPPELDSVDEMVRSQRQTEDAGALVMLLAPKAIRDAYQSAWAALLRAHIVSIHRVASEETVENLHKAFEAPCEQLLVQLRLDLGVDPDEAETAPAESAPQSGDPDARAQPEPDGPQYRGPH